MKIAMFVRLMNGMFALASEEIATNTFYGGPPPQADSDLQRVVFSQSISVVLRWCDESEAADTLPRLQQLKKSIRESAQTWLQNERVKYIYIYVSVAPSNRSAIAGRLVRSH